MPDANATPVSPTPTPAAVPPAVQVITVSAPSAHPAHVDYAKLLAGIAGIVKTAAPLVLNLVPSPQLGIALVGSELGLAVGADIAQLLAQLHPAA